MMLQKKEHVQKKVQLYQVIPTIAMYVRSECDLHILSSHYLRFKITTIRRSHRGKV